MPINATADRFQLRGLEDTTYAITVVHRGNGEFLVSWPPHDAILAYGRSSAYYLIAGIAQQAAGAAWGQAWSAGDNIRFSRWTQQFDASPILTRHIQF